MSRRTQNVLWLLSYLAVIWLVVMAMMRARSRLVPELAQPDAQANWQTWRDDVEQKHNAGPVRRRVPKSSEPPLLVLLRDYFGTCLAAAIFFTSLLFGVTMVFLRGAWGNSPAQPPDAQGSGE